VRGFGGTKHWIRTFPDAAIGFFNVWGTFKSLFGKQKGVEFDILNDFTGCVRPGEAFHSKLVMLTIDVTGLGRAWERMHNLSPRNSEPARRLFEH
jgi:hypothetical protein